MRTPKALLIVLICGAIGFFIVGAACSSGDGDGGAAPTPTVEATAITTTGTHQPTGATPTETESSAFDMLNGDWTGSWQDDTFGTAASITMSFTINENGTASATFDLPSSGDNTPFGLSSPDTITLHGEIQDNVLTFDLADDPLFGTMTATILPDGTFEAGATMDGAPGIDVLDIQGTFGVDGMQATYTISFTDGTNATGSAILAR